MTNVVLNQAFTVVISKPSAYASEPNEEYFTSLGGYRKLVSNESEEGITLTNNIKDIYGDVLDNYPSYHLGHYDLDNTITVFTPSFDNNIPVLELKFYLNTKEAARKEVTLFKELQHNYLLPEGSFIFSTGIYKPLDEYSFPTRLYDYIDIYFKCDHDLVCKYFNYNFPKGEFRTYYGASINTVTNETSKVKSYTYNIPSKESYWDEYYTKLISKL